MCREAALLAEGTTQAKALEQVLEEERRSQHGRRVGAEVCVGRRGVRGLQRPQREPEGRQDLFICPPPCQHELMEAGPVLTHLFFPEH